MSAAHTFHGVNGGGHVYVNHAQALHALLALHRVTGNPRAFQGRIEPVPLQAAQMQQHILRAIVRDDKAIAARHIEPFHETGDAIDFRAGFK